MSDTVSLPHRAAPERRTLPPPRATHPVAALLVATDLQRSADPVVDAARQVAERLDAVLHLVHVHTPGAVPRRLRGRDPEAGREALYEARRGLALQAEALGRALPEGLLGAAEVVTGASPHKEILRRARAEAADLLVVGTHAPSGGSRRLGSTADRLVRTSPVPCLVVRGEARLPFRRAAVLTDFSAASRAGLRVALSWLPGLGLDAPGARLDVVHVGDPQTVAVDPGAEARLAAEIEKEVALASEGAPPMPAEVRARVLWSFQAGDAVLAEAAEAEWDVVVVATHGRSALPRALVGSVALGLLHGAACPVLVVPPPRRRRR